MPVYLPGLTLGGRGYGGASFGYSPYGGGAFPRLPVSVSGGFGGDPFGYGSYGSVDLIQPTLTGASSLDGFRVELFFSEEMKNNAALTEPSNYIFSSTLGVDLVSESVQIGIIGALGGVTSVIVSHSGSTLGGSYLVHAINLEDIADNPILNSLASFYAFGDTTSVEVSTLDPDDGRTVLLEFRDSRDEPQALLTEAQFSPGVNDPSSYAISTGYPVVPTLSTPTQGQTDFSIVTIDVHPMTSTTYGLTIGPSSVFDYNGSVLPDDDPNILGVEVGTGTSSASLANGLILGKILGNTYGWEFGDASGLLVDGSTFRVDFEIDSSVASISPPVFNSTLGTLVVSDGAVELYLTLDDTAGVKVLGLTSGGLSASFPAAWNTSGGVVVSLVRNQRAGFYSVLLDGVPLYSAAIAEATAPPTIAAGTALYLGPAHAVSTFKVRGISVTASSTLFTSSWNFLHNLNVQFTGSSVLARDRVITKHGPLVRGWGDDTPATIRDVEVRVNSVVVEIDQVNPYVGHIFPAIPIPRGMPGSISVDVDYIWLKNPAFALAGLNTEGLALNVWSRAVGKSPEGVAPLPSTSRGVMARHRFPMGVVLGPLVRKSPMAIGHRYIGFQKGGYSALLNSPTTMLLNQNPHRVSLGGVSASSISASGAYRGDSSPQESETPWILEGVDSGGIVGDGTWRIIDNSSGPFGVGTAAIYRRELDLSLPTTIDEAGRFKVESSEPDGVFSGVGFGIHDGNHLLLVGALSVEGVMHFGVLRDGANPHLEESWEIGPSASASAISKNEITVPYSQFISGVTEGSRFRISSGSQAGIYTIEACGVVLSDDGAEVSISFSPDLPGDVNQLGNDSFAILYETPWNSALTSLRVSGEWPEGSVSVLLAGALSGTVANVSPLAPYPAQTALLLPNSKKGVAFWGSISRRATNQSIWDLVLYSSYPERILQTVQGLTVQTEMNVLPPDDPNDPWSIVGGFGYSEVDSTGNQILLKATSAAVDANIDEEFSFRRIEPFFSPKVSNDLEAKFRIESGYLGVGDISIVFSDGVRKTTFSPLLYTEGAGLRRLVSDLPKASLSGLVDPQTEGWVRDSGTIDDPYAQGMYLTFEKSTSQTGSWHKDLGTPSTASYEGLISEIRSAIVSGSNGSSGLGIGAYHGCQVQIAPGQSRFVGLTFDASGGLILFDASLSVVATVPFSWTDGLPHTYRLLCDPSADSVVLVVDDSVILTETLSDFTLGSSTAQAIVGAVGNGSCVWRIYSSSAIPLRPLPQAGQTLGRTFGILLRGGNPDSITGYAIPRSDSSEAANSSLSAIPVQMDWRDWTHIRLLYDPLWGVSFYRPDLALPPWHTGNYATRSTDPTASWVTVEYARLPVEPEDRGFVAFGAISPLGISQSRWDFFRYRLRGNYAGFGIAPQNMVLNRAFTFNSGEWNFDRTPESRTIYSRARTLLVLSDSAILADRVFVVQVGDTVLPSTGYSFDKDSQNLTLNSPLPAEQYPVTVSFVAKRPVTKEYLCSQPFEGSVTVLNDGTPPVPKSRQVETTSQVISGARINDPRDVLDNAESLVLNDPYRFVEEVEGDNSLYARTQFCEVSDGDPLHISVACDDGGFGAIGLEGQWSSEEFSVPFGHAGPWRGQSPVVGGSASKFSQVSIMATSGGTRRTYGVLGGGVASISGTSTPVLYPNGRGPSWNPLSAGTRFGFNQDILWILEDTTPREEVFDVQGTFSDNTPPSDADPSTDPNVDGAPGTFGNGAVAYRLEDSALSPFSRLGPWGGGSVLATRSILTGGSALTGSAFILRGGSALPIVISVTSGKLEATS